MWDAMNEFGRRNIPCLFIIDFEAKQPVVVPLESAAEQNIFFNIKGFKNYLPSTLLPEQVTWNKRPVAFEQYRKAFDLVQYHLRIGDSFLVNLTLPTPVKTNLSLQQIFEYSIAPYRLWYKDQFVVFSPESFVTIQNGMIASFPMKGTIDAQMPDAEQIILNDAKEKAEHNTIVDLIRNDLSSVAEKVRVTQFRYLDRISTNTKDLLQVSSKITGQLPANYTASLGDIFQKLLPAGSICGAPKPKTLSIIRQAEQYHRGYYTGIFGYYVNGNVESGVMIRFIEQNEQGLIYKSGGGITVFSEAEKEYQELIDKVYVPIHRNNPHFQWQYRASTLAQ
ncbi:MAG: aminodeoxychorismate synthase component I [Saprospiraceae bacterium]|nr:aminodeoxychorismate synthase component I [Saprospiraceae bacterium]